MVDTTFSNKNIAELLRNISAAYQLNPREERNLRFKIIAYEKAADSIEHLSRELKDIWQEGKLYKVPGVGEGIGSALEELFKKGESTHFNDILKGIPASVFVLMKVPGIGPKRAFRLVSQFGLVNTESVVNDLMNIARANKISALEGFGKKSQEDIIEALLIFQQRDKREERMPLPYAFDLSQEVSDYLNLLPEVKRIDVLGSLRRWVSSIGDIDIAVMADKKDSQKIVNHFLTYPGLRSIEGAGSSKASIIAAGNIRIDLRVQEEKSYGSMLQYFTGSKAHNIKLREYAMKKGFSLSEYGIKKGKGKNPIVKEFNNEKSLYEFLNLQYIPPEIREGTTEIEIAIKNSIPKLVELSDIKGDFHIHSSYDLKPSHDRGLNSYEELVEKAKHLKYEYIGFADHNPKISGLSSEEVLTIMKERKAHIDKVLSSSSIPYFIGLEVDILPNGELALPEKAFAYVDFLIVSVHSSFKMSINDMTKRVLKALSNPKVKIFGHPTARLLGTREGIELHWDEIFNFVKGRNIALEINASPSRLDLPDTLVYDSGKLETTFIINTDSHKCDHMDFMNYGVSVARRGWIQKNQIINSQSFEKVKNWINSN